MFYCIITLWLARLKSCSTLTSRYMIQLISLCFKALEGNWFISSVKIIPHTDYQFKKYCRKKKGGKGRLGKRREGKKEGREGGKLEILDVLIYVINNQCEMVKLFICTVTNRYKKLTAYMKYSLLCIWLNSTVGGNSRAINMILGLEASCWVSVFFLIRKMV